MFRQRKFLIYLSVFLSAFLSLPACGSGGLEVAASGAPITSTVHPDPNEVKSERLQQVIEDRARWQAAETANYLNGVKAEREAAQRAASEARKRAAEQSTVHAASVASAGITGPSPGTSECMTNSSKSWDTARACWFGLIASYAWPAETMFSIMFCESHGNPNAYNKTPVYSNGQVYHAQGLMQILGGPYDPAASVAKAHEMWSERGTQPWRACGG